MVEFVLTINNPKDGKSYKKEISGAEADSLLNKKVGESIKGDLIGFKKYELKITGGSDNNGFPIRKDIPAGPRKRPLIVSGIGARLKSKGVKQKKTVCGNIINEEIKQINLKVEKEGTKKLEEIFNTSKEEKTEETISEEPKKEEPKKEVEEKEQPKKEEKTEGKETKNEGKPNQEEK